MKVLVGTPVHESKEYSIKRWLKSISEQTYPLDLLIVDNSPSHAFTKKLSRYCKDYSLKPTIKHLTFKKNNSVDSRIEASQEIIRQYVVSHNYEAWLSWECDQIVPPNATEKIVSTLCENAYSMVIHNSWARVDSGILNTNMGFTLIDKTILEKIFFVTLKDTDNGILVGNTYDINDPSVIKKKVLQAGGTYVELYGVITPIHHLNQ